jgi:6-phosphogluconolactonase
VQISPTGDWLYGSNRGHDSLVIFALDQKDGMLTRIGHASTEGHIPRGFTVDPAGDWVLVANQDSDNLVVFRVDHNTGALDLVSATTHVPTPVCVKVL